MAGRLGSGWRGQTGTMKCCPMHAMQDLDFSKGRETGSHEGNWLGDDLDEGAKNGCMWIQTSQGYVAKLG